MTDPSPKDTFRLRVWALVSAIPAGQLMTYGQIAHALGSGRAARIVGGALASLPNGTDVPWHRVVGRGGVIVTHGRDGNAHVQATRLQAEGVEVGEDLICRRVAAHLWWPDAELLDTLGVSVEARFLLDEWAARQGLGVSRPRNALRRGRAHWDEPT